MPPRIQTQRVSNSLLPYLSSSPSISTSLSSLPPSSSSSSCSCLSSSSSSLPVQSNPHKSSPSATRPFSSTMASNTRHRSRMFDWLNGPGNSLKNHIPGSTNYLTDLRDRELGISPSSSPSSPQGGGKDGGEGGASAEGLSATAAGEDRVRPMRPFPLNPSFVSESVLSEELRGEIYRRIVGERKGVREVSVELGVDMRRVGAVVRLVELERRWVSQGKPRALPYARAVREMVPTTPLATDGRRQIAHESINDLPVHRLTDPQIFYPVSESRQFTRVDAGRVFSAAPALEHNESPTKDLVDPVQAATRLQRNPKAVERVGKGEEEEQVLQPADVRIPHPHLVTFERDRVTYPNERNIRRHRYETRLKMLEDADKDRKRLAKEREEKRTMKVEPGPSRFEFRFVDVNVSPQTTGHTGRNPRGVGRRYGVPNYDRKKGQVKIPTKVEI